MSTLKLYLQEKNILIANKVTIADNFINRALGLMGKKSMDPSSALWIKSCSHIHTFFMNFAIDLIFVDKNLVVKKVCLNAQPWKHFFTGSWRADSVFELPEGSIIAANIKEGDQLYVGA
ncbi:MAG: DUF192 domain-containing protein [Bdellovibrionales bacterium]|nr:DUF192 domain-containing protein [Bdellovibrionales bacterium]